MEQETYQALGLLLLVLWQAAPPGDHQTAPLSMDSGHATAALVEKPPQELV